MFELILPQPLMALIRRCEVLCVAACCGEDAFDPEPDNMISWMSEHGIQRIWDILDQMSETIRDVSEHLGSVLSDQNEFNMIWDTSGKCVEYLCEWKNVIIEAAERFAGHPLIEKAWLTSTVVALAEAIHEDRGFDLLPILADALQEAGCENADILNHCRQPEEHLHGCGVVDLLTGRK
jgi:hypothetical protein